MYRTLISSCYGRKVSHGSITGTFSYTENTFFIHLNFSYFIVKICIFKVQIKVLHNFKMYVYLYASFLNTLP